MNSRAATLVVPLLGLVSAVAILAVTPRYPKWAQHFPMFIGYLLLILCLIGAGVTWLRHRPVAAAGDAAAGVMPAATQARAVGVMMGIVLAFAVAITVLGFLAGSALFIFLFLRLWGRLPWAVGAAGAVGTFVLLYGIGWTVPDLQLFPGLVFGSPLPRW